jgi:hypothetical protein
MLNSALQHLGRPSRTARLDAYLALNGALKTYDGIPEPEAILNKSGLLMQFMARDLAWKDDEGRVDRQIVTQALHLACAIIFNARTAQALDEEFRSFLLDRSINALEQPDTPKAIIKGHALLLCQYRLHISVMTPVRAEKLISALHTIQERCSGSSIIPARFIIYHRLLEQAPGTMLSKMREWIEHVFHGLLSNVKEARTRALETLTAAGLSLGTNFQAAKGIYELFERGEGEGETYGDFFLGRLRAMIEDSEMAPFVPQVWAAIILFLRSKRRPFERWPSIKDWLMILQQCLNSGDNATRHQAHIAWNKLVFAVMPDSSTSDNFRSMLKVPILVGLKTRVKDKHTQVQRTLAMESYCNLVYYALRPGLSHDEVDKAWALYIDEVLGLVARYSSRGLQFTCNVLQGLFSRGDEVWNVNAANEPRAIKPEDLPRLEPRWIRSRFVQIVKLMEPILAMDLNTQIVDRSPVDRCWQACLMSIAEAGSQEVKTSNELKEVIAQLTNLFRRLWSTSNGRQSASEMSAWLTRFQYLLKVAVETLGQGHFVQDFLINTCADEVEATLTPSSRPSKHPMPQQPSAVFLLALHGSATEAMCQSEAFARSPGWLLRLLIDMKSSASASLALLQRALQMGISATSGARYLATDSLIWTAIAGVAVDIAESQANTPLIQDGQIGTVVTSALSILRHGVLLSSEDQAARDLTLRLYAAVCTLASQSGGEGSLVVGVIEPFAKSIVDMSATVTIDAAAELTTNILKHSRWVKSRQVLDTGRKFVGIRGLDSPKTTAFDPFDHVYAVICTTSNRAYLANWRGGVLRPFFDSYVHFLETCPSAILATALKQSQGAIIPWVEDKEQQVFRSAASVEPSDDVPECITRGWMTILDLLRSLPRKDQYLLRSLESLLLAGFSSPSRDVVNATITFWNDTFGIDTALSYPLSLEAVLFARSLQADLLLPGLREDTDNIASLQLPDLVESSQTKKTAADIVPDLGISSRIASMLRRPETENTLIKQHLAQTASARKETPEKMVMPRLPVSLPRLRHDDSQIDFAPVESSSPISEDVSQLLTDRQREVRARQQDDARMYPQMSSSPFVPAEPAVKRLVFTPSALDVGVPRCLDTPDEINDANPMSDDLPSSPTPQAIRRELPHPESQLPVEEENEEDLNDLDSAPPSSPPRGSASEPEHASNYASPVEDSLQAELGTTDATVEDEPVYAAMADAVVDQELDVSLELPSDTSLPTAQLLREEAAAGDGDLLPEQSVGIKEPALPTHPQQSFDQLTEDVGHSNDAGSSRATSPTETRDSSHIEAAPASHAEQPARPHTSGKKRRRASGIRYTARKRKPSSPLKKLVSNALGQPQLDDDDDIGEEIIVASSQSPGMPFAESPNQSLSTNNLLDEDQKGDPAIAVVEPERESPVLQLKRGRGRPRKQDDSNKTGAEPVSKSLKRRASNMSAGADSEAAANADDAPVKVRKLHEGCDKSIIRESPLSQDSLRTARVTRRSSLAAKAYVKEEEPDQPADSEISDEATLSQELTSSPTAERKIAQPKSLLGRLRGILSECRNIILGSQEEREFDNVLYEMRREIHEAGQRSAEMNR